MIANPIANPMNLDNRGPQVSGVAGFFLALSTIAIALRCYCRIFVVKSFGADDSFAVVAWVINFFFSQVLVVTFTHIVT